MTLSIWIALIACVVGCYIAACNIALKTLSRKRLADLLSQRGKTERLEPFLKHLHSHLLTTAMLRAASIIVVVLATLYAVEIGFLESSQQQPVSHLLSYAIAFLIAGVLISVMIVAIPVSWAKYQREVLLARSMVVLTVLTTLLLPLVRFLHLVDPVIRRISGADLNSSEQDSDITDEVLTVVEDHQAGADVNEEQKDMLEAVFDLPNTTAGEIMTPRTDMIGIEINASLETVKQAVLEHGHSRIPVYENNLDNIRGMLYAKDLLRFVGQAGEFDLESVLREPFLVPESKSVHDLLTEFKQRKVHIAIVLDEYGGTAGLVTIEDILEEIVGEIQDEYEPQEEEPQVVQIDDNTVEADARIHIDDLNDEMDIELPEGEDYDTLGGFVFSTLGHIPENGESFEHQNIRLTVTEAERTKVKRVRLERLTGSPATGNGQGAT